MAQVYPAFERDGKKINPAVLSTDGNLWLQFYSLENKPVFGSLDLRRALMQQFNVVKSVHLTDEDLKRKPKNSS